MLRVDLRELAQGGGGAVDTQGELKQDDPALDGVDISLRDPVSVTGRLQSLGEGRFYWLGTALTVVEGECRRCLTAVATPVLLVLGAAYTQDPAAVDDPDAYLVRPGGAVDDVTAVVRVERV